MKTIPCPSHLVEVDGIFHEVSLLESADFEGGVEFEKRRGQMSKE
jgi:hypothetical protein